MALPKAHRPAGELAPFGRLPEVTQRLRTAHSVGELLAAAATATRAECGFSRGVVLGLCGNEFNAVDSDPLSDPASDRLRRTVLSQPIPLVRGSDEADLVATNSAGVSAGAGSPLATALGLQEYVLAPILLDGSAAALLVLDRDIPEVRGCERALVRSYAAVIGILLEQLLLRSRVTDVASELRRLTAFTHALMRESADGQMALPSARDQRPSLPGVLTAAGVPKTGWDYKLTAQELRVAKLLAAGRSNREIAAEMVLSVETVKSHVARVLQKLGVSNRAQAAIVFANGPGDRRESREFTPRSESISPVRV